MVVLSDKVDITSTDSFACLELSEVGESSDYINLMRQQVSFLALYNGAQNALEVFRK